MSKFKDEFLAYVTVGFIACVLFYLVWSAIQYCLDARITEGKVIFKRFVPEHVETYTTYVDMGEDMPKIPVEHSRVVPDYYEVTIEGINNGEIRKRHFQVDRTSYQLISSGDWLKIDDLPLKPIAEEDDEI